MNKSNASERVKRYRKGHRAETLAALYLRLKGFQILDRRYRSHFGEIDIVARRKLVLSFIEVKARRSFEIAAHSVSATQQQRIINAALVWQGDHAQFTGFDLSFDIILLVPWRWPVHLKNAFPD